MREKIIEDLKQAMKDQDKELLAVIRMVKGAISLEEINKKRELTDDEVIDVISKQIKTRKESITEFLKGNRQDLIDGLNREIELLSKYLPEQLSEEDIRNEIDKVFDKVKPTSMKDMGTIMKELGPVFKGKADMKLVNNIVREKLN